MMRYFWPTLVFASTLLAQSTTTTYQTDVNGRRVASATTDKSATGTTVSARKSVDGKALPLDEATERVIRQDANGKLVERIIKKYDQNGRVSSTEKVMVEETVLPGGGKTVKETVSQSDLNGTFKEVERRTSETRVSGLTTTTTASVDHANINGAFTAAEKRSTVTTGPVGKQQTTETVERPDPNGRFRAISRQETSVAAAGSTVTSNTAGYELDATGRLQLTRQAVATTTKRPDGSATTETNLYTADAAGRPNGGAAKLVMQEQQVQERKVAADGSFTETVSIRTANPSDPSKLSAARNLSETVCRGKCVDNAKAAAPVAPAAPVTAPAAKQDAKGKKLP
ncbi:MAG: hypothetical protein ABI811_00840 [Acidobacteriota bacterium]